MKGWMLQDGWMLYGILWRDLFIVLKKEKVMPREKYVDPDWEAK